MDLMSQVLLNSLYYYGTRGSVKESLLQRYFSMVLLIPLQLSFPLAQVLRHIGALLIIQIHSGLLLSDVLCRTFVVTVKILNQRLSKPAEVLVFISFIFSSVVKMGWTIISSAI